jgi:hypothetical protein
MQIVIKSKTAIDLSCFFSSFYTGKKLASVTNPLQA